MFSASRFMEGRHDLKDNATGSRANAPFSPANAGERERNCAGSSRGGLGQATLRTESWLP